MDQTAQQPGASRSAGASLKYIVDTGEKPVVHAFEGDSKTTQFEGRYEDRAFAFF
jgi:hypothetical protein